MRKIFDISEIVDMDTNNIIERMYELTKIRILEKDPSILHRYYWIKNLIYEGKIDISDIEKIEVLEDNVIFKIGETEIEFNRKDDPIATRSRLLKFS